MMHGFDMVVSIGFVFLIAESFILVTHVAKLNNGSQPHVLIQQRCKPPFRVNDGTQPREFHIGGWFEPACTNTSFKQGSDHFV